MSYSQGVTSALSARAVLKNSFFGGWEISDFDLLSCYKFTSCGTPDFVTDFFGVKTSVVFVQWAEGNGGGVFADFPLPDDGIRAEPAVYFAMLQALENSPGESFAVIELGSS